MICIRIFKTREEAEWARDVLKEGGIHAIVSEDTFNHVPIQKFGVQARFRLKVEDRDFPKTTLFLAKKLKRAKT